MPTCNGPGVGGWMLEVRAANSTAATLANGRGVLLRRAEREEPAFGGLAIGEPGRPREHFDDQVSHRGCPIRDRETEPARSPHRAVVHTLQRSNRRDTGLYVKLPRSLSNARHSARRQMRVYPRIAMEYDDELRWLLTLPDFERTGEFAGRPDVATMRALLAALGDPHLSPGRARGRPTVHVAGSKGKGSTAVMAAAMLDAAGVRTGCYVSPHLHRYTERIRIGGTPVEPETFASAMATVRAAMEAVAPRFASPRAESQRHGQEGRRFLAFDALTAAAFVVFRGGGVDAQVVEVGLGGLLDSTNVFDATDVVVLTPISLEHTAILGTTIAEIAAQKAGIITPGATVVVAPQRESALDVFRATAAERGASIIEVAAACQMTRTKASADGQEFRIRTPRATYEARLPLAGRHQLDNAATAIVACEELVAEGDGIELTPAHVRAGLASVVWPCRLEVLKRAPLVIVDGAHNGDSAKRMAAALPDFFGASRATLIFGTLAGKDVEAIAAAVAPIAESVHLPFWPHARAADPRELADAFRPHGAPVTVWGDVAAAVDASIASAGGRGTVLAFGSLAFAAAVRECILGIESDMIRLTIQRPAGDRPGASQAE
ncbi:MAG: bifunctional folylpolyglutamate synthase/dihydrofolate synthase [Dehalococcoidia bacterium]|nr:MAG: bifunctional folylpolyglutamate synthase/dihydrofolate synthase [Dehalococcoidia bacterium]